jgi:hypothetical protein
MLGGSWVDAGVDVPKVAKLVLEIVIGMEYICEKQFVHALYDVSLRSLYSRSTKCSKAIAPINEISSNKEESDRWKGGVERSTCPVGSVGVGARHVSTFERECFCDGGSEPARRTRH